MWPVASRGSWGLTGGGQGGGSAPAPLAKYLVDQGVSGPGGVQLTAASSQYLATASNAPSSLQLDARSFSFAGWFRADSLDTGAGNQLLSIYLGGPHRGFQLFFTGSVVEAAMYDASNSNGVTAGTPTASSWYFVVATYNASTLDLKLSLNAGTVSTSNFEIDIPANLATPFQLGALAGSTLWDGQLLSWGKWDKVLSAGEITTLFNGGTPLTYSQLSGSLLTSLAAWWNLDQTTGNRLDSVGSAHLVPSGTPVKIIAPTRWADQSGHGNDITWPADMTSRPLPIWIDNQQNGLPVFRFTRLSGSTGTYVASASMGLSSLGALTVLAVAKSSDAARGFVPWSNFDGSAGLKLYLGATGTFDRMDDGTNLASVNPYPGSASLGNYRLVGGQLLGSVSKIYGHENGSAGCVIASTSTPQGRDYFEIGRLQASSYFSGDVGDIYVYGGAS